MALSVLLLILVFAAWAGLHSLTAAFASKSWARRTFGPSADRWYRLAYNFLALITFLPVLTLIAALPDQILYAVPAPWSWLMRLGQLAALAGLALAFLQTTPLHFLGVSQLSAQASADAGALVVRGFYCRVRHPLYMFSILLVWLTPTMSVLWLVACVLITAYFYLGSLHEERRLLAEFGDAYAAYRRRVPMLIPRPGRCVQPSEPPGSDVAHGG